MARNEEKAQAMLNRFVSAKSAANKEDKSTRPYLATDCDNLRDCERYRGQIIKEITKKVSLIQNEGLEEHKVMLLSTSRGLTRASCVGMLDLSTFLVCLVSGA